MRETQQRIHTIKKETDGESKNWSVTVTEFVNGPLKKKVKTTVVFGRRDHREFVDTLFITQNDHQRKWYGLGHGTIQIRKHLSDVIHEIHLKPELPEE